MLRNERGNHEFCRGFRALKNFHYAAVTLCCALSAVLTACAGAPLQSLTTHASTFDRPANSNALPHRDVLYASDPISTRVDIYPLNANNPAPIGGLTGGIETPTGMALDSAHNLYIANNTDNKNVGHTKSVGWFVTLFAPGQAQPESAYFQGLHSPTDVVVGADGTVYVASFGDGYVTEYPAGSMLPSQHFLPPSGNAIALTLDAQNNLYVACAITNAVFKFAPGSTQGTSLGLSLNGEPHGMAVDQHGNLLVAVSTAPVSGSAVDVFPPGKTHPSAQFTGVFQPFMIALDRDERHLYVADYGSGNHDGAVFEFAYPTGTLIGKYTQGAASAAYGVAVNPPAPL
jgi:DNA-binding beta-propeller fold protein YncE